MVRRGGSTWLAVVLVGFCWAAAALLAPAWAEPAKAAKEKPAKEKEDDYELQKVLVDAIDQHDPGDEQLVRVQVLSFVPVQPQPGHGIENCFC